VLFDLRSPKRQVAVKAIYGTLAVLMGGGLIFFGIGSNASGGLADLFGSGGSSDSGFEDQIDDAEKQVEENPRNQEALLELVTLNLQAGKQQAEGLDENTGYPIFGSDSEDSFAQAADAWARYLRLKPKHPDDGVALQLADAYFLLAVNGSTAADARTDLENAAEAQQIAVDENPIVGNLNRLATYLYFAGSFQRADAVAAQLLAKAPANQREALRKQLEGTEKQARAFQKQVEAEAKGAAAGGNPLEEPGALGGGSSIGGSSLSTP
jgi:hypothetical protein